MKKLILPRKDHEVYFLLKPQAVVNNRQLQEYCSSQMEKLHPGFSVSAKTDIKHIYINNAHWLMVTVMEEELLAEYRILNANTVFYTNTSIVTQDKDFLINGIRTVDDESIGFDSQKNVPVSVPLEIKDPAVRQLSGELKNVPMRHGVFNQKLPKWVLAAASVFMALVIALVSLSVFTKQALHNTRMTESALPITLRANEYAETVKQTVPSPLETLSRIAVDTVNAGGKLTQWQCNADREPYMTLQIHGISLSGVYGIFSRYEYMLLQDIQEIRYGENEPDITVFLNINAAEYEATQIKTYPMQDFTFPMITELSGALKNNGIAIVTETLPAAGNGYLAYTITYTASDRNMIRSLDILADTCNKYALQVRTFDVRIDNNSRFTVACTLSPSAAVEHKTIAIGNEKNYLPAAFGYIQEEPKFIESVILPGKPVIGSISDGSGRIVFYSSSSEGKIQVRTE